MITLNSQSGNSEFGFAHLLNAVGWMLGAGVLFAVAMHAGAWLQLLPAPRPTLDTDRTILIHQAEASRRPQAAEIILIGDSSCMMDVDAVELSRALSQKVLNLGTLSYLDLLTFGEIIRHYETASPNQLRTVVLLCHPEFLRRLEPVVAQVQALKKFFAGEDFHNTASWRGQLNWWLGIDIFRGRIASRFVPVPLPRDFARFYGFSNWELLRSLDERQGSAVDPRSFVLQAGQGNAEYRLAARLEHDSAAFRAALPKGVQLVAGITPVPKSFVPPIHEERQQQMLAQWSRWLRADSSLTNMPASLPDENFATTTHLSETGGRVYTKLLARELAALKATSPTTAPH